MSVTPTDIALFAAFYLVVLSFSVWKSRGKKDSAGYFLGRRALPWWLIGISIVAANLSTEQFVGMAGQAAGDVGFAVSSWQILSSIAVVAVDASFSTAWRNTWLPCMRRYPVVPVLTPPST